jgi:hypothetical protein
MKSSLEVKLFFGGIVSAGLASDGLRGFEFRYRPVGEPDLVVFAAMKHLDDEFE